jgi:D-alanyl-lipoteichoic acid acyltransferase DltB (MBOAT superfamily)
LSNISSKAFSSFKYVYLIAFFALLSGVFYPLITNTSFEPVISGILILFLGLAGGILLYKATTSETKRGIFFGVGLILIGISSYFIFQFTGRV